MDSQTIGRLTQSKEHSTNIDTYGAYKRIDQKIKPVSQRIPPEFKVTRTVPYNPLTTLVPIDVNFLDPEPTKKFTQERIDKINNDMLSHDFLSPEERKLFLYVLIKNEAAIAFVDEDRGTLKESYFSPYKIPHVPHEPWQQKNIPIPPGLREKVIELLQLKIKAGVYEPCQSSYRSRWFCTWIPAKQKLRIVHDLQLLNGVTIKESSIPPNLDQFVDQFLGGKCFTVLDLYWGFDARKMDETSRDMTAFYCPIGLLRLTSLPTGFTNSPSEFQECMVFIFNEEIVKQVMNVFIDDAPIRGPITTYPDDNGNPAVLPERPEIRRYIWEHAIDLNRILHRLIEAGGTFSGKKLQICQPKVTILGQEVGVEGRKPDAGRVKTITNWPTPKNVKEARQFMGLCGTVRIWIPNYSQIASSITSLWRKGVEFVWTEEQEAAFEALKEYVTTAPVLTSIDYTCDRPIVLSVDSSYMGVGMILSQIDTEGRKRPTRYGSLPFSKTEANYSQPKLELYGLFRALRHFRIYIIGVRNLIVEVDAKYIKGMLNEPELQPNAVINRWIQGILLFDFTLVHVPGIRFRGPDALSRRPREDEDGDEVETYDDSWLDEIALFYGDYGPTLRRTNGILNAVASPDHSHVLPAVGTQETTLEDIFQYLTNPEPAPASRNFLKKVTKYFVKAGRMFKRTKTGRPLLVILDSTKREELLEQAHESLGHHGEKATWETLRNRFYWPQMYQDVRQHVKSCHECQIRSTFKAHLPITTPPPSTVFTKVHIDIMLMPQARGYRYIVLARDDLSKYVEGRALRKASASAVARFVMDDIILRYGCIGRIVTDNGPEFKGALSELLRQYDIPQVLISPYNSQANGVVEQGHFAIREALVKACEGNIHLWPEKLRAALFADNITVRRSTGYSAYFLVHGTDPVLPFDLWESTFLVEGFKDNLSQEELLSLRIRQIERRDEDMHKAMQTLRQSRLNSKRQFEKRFETRLVHGNYPPGTLVLIRNTAIEKELNRKTKPRYLGPYKVVRQTKGSSYVLAELDGTELSRPIAAFRVIPYIQRSTLKTLTKGPDLDEEDSDKYGPDYPTDDDKSERDLIKLPHKRPKLSRRTIHSPNYSESDGGSITD